jgi:electron transport complex protein RnfB
MVEGAYAQLAKALDLLPGGFPQTPSRVELRLLEKAFSKEEVELAGKMSRQHERCEDLATRAGMAELTVRDMLRRLLPRRLVRERVVDGR